MFLSSTTGREFTFKSSHSPNPTSSRNVPPGVSSVIKFKPFCKLLTSNTKHVNNSHFPCEVHRQNLYIPKICTSPCVASVVTSHIHTGLPSYTVYIYLINERINKNTHNYRNIPLAIASHWDKVSCDLSHVNFSDHHTRQSLCPWRRQERKRDFFCTRAQSRPRADLASSPDLEQYTVN